MDDMTLLAKLNRVRAEYELYYLRALPAGVPSNCGDCVWARALQELDPDILVSDGWVETVPQLAASLFREFGVAIQPGETPYRSIVILGDEAKAWLSDYDAGRKPHLVAA